MSSSVISMKLKQKILPGRVTVGTFDEYGKGSTFTGASDGQRILMFPLDEYGKKKVGGRQLEISGDQFTFLNINEPISCIYAASLNPLLDNHSLFVGTSSSLFAYDVLNNKDLFFKQVVDGVNVMAIGTLGSLPALSNPDGPILIVGGNCSLQGFDEQGNDVFWTVTGDNVGAIALFDFDGDGLNEMVVGSDDYDIRIFKGDQLIGEITETDAVTLLVPLQADMFAYALANGTIGVYERTHRLWRIKSKNQAVSICAFDFDGDGRVELVTGWSNGKLDIRSILNGEVLFKDNFIESLAGVATMNAMTTGTTHLIACDIQGELRMYLGNTGDGKMNYLSPTVEQDAVRELNIKKHHLLLELKNYEISGIDKKKGSSTPEALIGQKRAASTKTDISTTFSIKMGTDDKASFIELTLKTSDDKKLIKAALIFAEGIFPGECHVVHPSYQDTKSTITVPLSPPKNVVVDLHIKAYVGGKDDKQFQVIELTRQLPRFAMFRPMNSISEDEITSFVRIPIEERPSRIGMWMTQNFLMSEQLEVKGGFQMNFLCLRTEQELQFVIQKDGTTIVRTLDMALAGDIVQSLAQYLGIHELQTEAEFSEEICQVELLLKSMDEYEESGERLGAQISDQCSIIKTLLIRAEDSRMISHSKGMREWYMQLHEMNRSLIGQHGIRCGINENISEAVKHLHQIVQKAARLRVGKAKANVISACRDAIRGRSLTSLVRIINAGANG